MASRRPPFDPNRVTRDMLDLPDMFVAGNPTDEQLEQARRQVKGSSVEGLLRILATTAIPFGEEWPELSERRRAALTGGEAIMNTVIDGSPLLPNGLFAEHIDGMPPRTAQLEDYHTALIRASREEFVTRAAAELGLRVVLPGQSIDTSPTKEHN